MLGPLGPAEIIFILVLALLIFGPRRLPEVGRTLGKAMGEFRRATTELKRSVNTELALEEESAARPGDRRRPPEPQPWERRGGANAAVARPETAGGAAAGAAAEAGEGEPRLRPAPGTEPATGPGTGPGAAGEDGPGAPPPAAGATVRDETGEGGGEAARAAAPGAEPAAGEGDGRRGEAG